tara:strand:+ start:110 stop:718 length:609 start_codon:yes stop_codon:yes gene_type:complete
MFIIGITGGTGSGKTTIINKINNLFDQSDVGFLSSDSYYKDNSNLNFSERDKLNYDTPDAIDFDLLNTHIKLLKTGQDINVPQYSFSTHLRLKTSSLFKPKKILIIEGILILSNRTLKNQINYNVFLDCSRNTRLKRRLDRDITERGRNHEDVIKLFENRLDKMHKSHVEPMRKECDLVLNTENNTKIDILIDIIKKILSEK